MKLPSTLSAKVAVVQSLLQPFYSSELAVFSGESLGWRMRAEFRVWHEEDQCYFVMFQQSATAPRKQAIRCDQLDIAHPLVNRTMAALHEVLQRDKVLRERLYQVDFLSTTTGQVLVTLIYHRVLEEEWVTAAKALSVEIQAQVIGRSRKQKIVLDHDYVTETLHVCGSDYHYRQYEGSFTQPNAQICTQMLTWVCQVAQEQQQQGITQDLLELYCGNGNFTLPLSRYFQNVLATEVSKSSIVAAHHNIACNHIENIKVARLSAEEFTQAYQQVRPFKRLMDAQIDLQQYDFSTVLVDPPRAGVDAQTLQLLQQFDHIYYISCNPSTLADNLQTLCQTHTVTQAAVFDQFPGTAHIESGVILCRKKT